jgi:hypothetical protein
MRTSTHTIAAHLRRAALTSAFAFLGLCGGRPKDETSTDDGARDSATSSTDGGADEPKPKPEV